MFFSSFLLGMKNDESTTKESDVCHNALLGRVVRSCAES